MRFRHFVVGFLAVLSFCFTRSAWPQLTYTVPVVDKSDSGSPLKISGTASFTELIVANSVKSSSSFHLLSPDSCVLVAFNPHNEFLMLPMLRGFQGKAHCHVNYSIDCIALASNVASFVRLQHLHTVLSSLDLCSRGDSNEISPVGQTSRRCD
jgi:hypothetical protein